MMKEVVLWVGVERKFHLWDLLWDFYRIRYQDLYRPP